MTRFFVSQAKMHLRQVSENQNSFEINLGCDTILRGHDGAYRVRGQFKGMCNLQRSQWICMRSEVGYKVRGQDEI